MQGTVLSGDAVAGEDARFIRELQKRRDLVYDYLENWPGSDQFKPADIHDALFSYVRHRGKGLRPTLLMLCAGLAGGDEMQALPAAAAVEIYQIWTLVHDDIIDRDLLRRGSPTVHSQYTRHGSEVFGLDDGEAAHYGVSVAILAGDLQQSWCYALLCDLLDRGINPRLVTKLVYRMATSLTPKLLEGEMLDVQYSLMPIEHLSEHDILLMLTGKTSALLEYSAWAGATIGLGDAGDADGLADKLGQFAALSGTAFQLQDDLLGLTADEAALGKPVGSDIREGKRTLLVYYTLTSATDEDRDKLLGILGNKLATEAEVNQAVDIIHRTGAVERVLTLANSYISQALNLLNGIPDSESKTLLSLWASFLLARKH